MKASDSVLANSAYLHALGWRWDNMSAAGLVAGDEGRSIGEVAHDGAAGW